MFNFGLPAYGILISASNLRCTTSSSRTTRWRITRIRFFNTSLVITDITTWAIRIPNTFWSTSSDGIRFRNQARFTPTNGVGISVALFGSSAPSSRSTRWRIARIRSGCGFLVQDTPVKRIANVSWRTTTDWIVIVNGTLGADSTSSWTRILALSIDTSQVGWTVILSDTLRFATGGRQRITKHTWQAFTKGLATVDSTSCVSSTGWRIARILFNTDWETTGERIADKSWSTLALFSQCCDQTIRIQSTWSWDTKLDQIRFTTCSWNSSWSESGQALTLRFASVSFQTFCVRSASIRMTSRSFNWKWN